MTITVELDEELARQFLSAWPPMTSPTGEKQTTIGRVATLIQAALPQEIPIDWDEDPYDLGVWNAKLREFDTCTARAMILRLVTQTYCIYVTRNNGDWTQLCSGIYSNFATLNQAKDLAEKWLRNS